MSTDIDDIEGTITYTHHVHSLTETGLVEINSSSDTDGYGTDSDYSDTQGGCYQTKTYDRCGNVYKVSGTPYEGSYEKDGTVWYYWWHEGRCPKCGTLNSKNTSNKYQNGATLTCTGSVFKGYKATCGYANGQIISATITY